MPQFFEVISDFWGRDYTRLVWRKEGTKGGTSEHQQVQEEGNWSHIEENLSMAQEKDTYTQSCTPCGDKDVWW